jgi:uncharacterized protein YeaO (DUF488 family)
MLLLNQVMMVDITIKRIYEVGARTDGVRILVDRLWPRGLRKEDAAIDLWEKELAPSPALRKWFAHDPKKWREFQERYSKELEGKKGLLNELRQKAGKSPLTLLYAAKDPDHNHAIVLRDFMLKFFTEKR